MFEKVHLLLESNLPDGKIIQRFNPSQHYLILPSIALTLRKIILTHSNSTLLILKQCISSPNVIWPLTVIITILIDALISCNATLTLQYNTLTFKKVIQTLRNLILFGFKHRIYPSSNFSDVKIILNIWNDALTFASQL